MHIPGVSTRYTQMFPKCDIKPQQKIIFSVKTFKAGIWQSIRSRAEGSGSLSDPGIWQSIRSPYTAYAVVLTKYCLNHCARTCCSLRIVTRCRFTNWPIRCERGGRNVHFLSINLISFRRSRGILFWLWLSQCGRLTAPVDSEIQRKMYEMLGISALKGYQVEALEAVCLNKRDTLVCVPTGSRNSACFEVGLICAVIDHVTVSERTA